MGIGKHLKSPSRLPMQGLQSNKGTAASTSQLNVGEKACHSQELPVSPQTQARIHRISSPRGGKMPINCSPRSKKETSQERKVLTTNSHLFPRQPMVDLILGPSSRAISRPSAKPCKTATYPARRKPACNSARTFSRQINGPTAVTVVVRIHRKHRQSLLISPG